MKTILETVGRLGFDDCSWQAVPTRDHARVDWRSSFSNPICFCWCRVLTRVPSCCTLAYLVWRNGSGWHLLCPSRSCTLRLHLLAVSVFPVKLTLASVISIHTVSCEVRPQSWSLFFELFPGNRYLCVGKVTKFV